MGGPRCAIKCAVFDIKDAPCAQPSFLLEQVHPFVLAVIIALYVKEYMMKQLGT